MQSILDLPGDNDVELLLRDKPVTIRISSLDEFLNLLIRDLLAKLISNSPEVLAGNEASPLIVKDGKNLVNINPGILVVDTLGHKIEPLTKVNGATAVSIEVSKHLEDPSVLGLESQRGHSGLEL